MWDYSEATVAYMVRRQTFEGWVIPMRRIVNYELVLVLRGTGMIEIMGKTYTAGPGDLIFFRPGIVNRLWVKQEPYFEFFGLHFNLPPGTKPPELPDLLHLDAPQRIEILFRKLHGIYLEKGHLHEVHENLLLQQILCELLTILFEKETSSNPLRIRQVLEYIHENLYREITLEELYSQSGLQKTAFIQLFRQVTGTTPLQYIIRQRLENARELLTESNLSVSQIAEQCGFSDPFYFSRCFSKHYGHSPREYRSARTYKA